MKSPGGPSARSMDVINGATDILNELNKLHLPLPEWDWSPEIDWWPGDPIHTPPVLKVLPWGHEYWQVPGVVTEDGVRAGGQHIRPMFQVFEADSDLNVGEYLMDCEECEVAGDPLEETQCWNCGKELARLWKPSDFDVNHFWDPGDLSSAIPYQTTIYSAGDAIEDFDSGPWTAINDTFHPTPIETTAMRRFLDAMELPVLEPWQERVVQEYAQADVAATQQMMSGGNIDNDGNVRLWTLFPSSRRSGRQYIENMVASWFEEGRLESSVPSNAEVHNSRSHPVNPQRTYPTSRNPTQERRRRNH